ncbi:Zn-ribbon domain-containing OB-fold protein [Streptomyces sp. NPDC048282]|uniref:Zn-ribbon domain-containing OB-fold protein n=1 Tax=Streptomyces sp. NPDC048282 TaxID=3365528 RepID=UPI00371F8933
MTGYELFLPEDIPAWQAPFWESLKAHDVRVQRCDACGVHRYVPKEICPSCQATAAAWAPVSGDGHIYTYSVVRRGPTKAYQATAPYVIAHVTMAEGFRMVGGLLDVDPEKVAIGDPVRVRYVDATDDWTLLAFGPA